MNTLIKAVEAWLPTPDGSLLEFGGGLYGRATAFGAISRGLCFGRGEGLPGRAWFDGQPIVLKELDSSYFRRADVAREAGYTCAIGLPLFQGAALSGVVVLFCGPDAVVAIRCDTGLARNTGLPGIHGSLTIPCRTPSDAYVLTLLPAAETPIALRMECWAPDEERLGLQRVSGICERMGTLRASDGGTVLAGSIGKAFASGVPVINEHAETEPGSLGDAARDAGLAALVAVPVMSNDGVDEVIALYF